MAIKRSEPRKPVTQKDLATLLGLSRSTISLVLNNAPLSAAIPESTRDRIFKAANKLNYRPDFYAKYLYTRRSYTVGLLLPEIGEGAATPILKGVDDCLTREKYFYFLANHHGIKKLIQEFPSRLLERAVEGFILFNTAIEEPLPCPAVSIGPLPSKLGITQILMDNFKGGWLALEHLARLGHKRIAVFKGHSWRAASAVRWNGVAAAAREFGITLNPKLILQLRAPHNAQTVTVPEEGYELGKRLLRSNSRFTALIAFNDISAIGAIRAFWDAGLRVPDDVSVVGYDDIEAAEYQIPRLTTVSAQWRSMGELAASTLVKLIGSAEELPREILVEPRFVVRESTRQVSPTAEYSNGK